MQQSQTRRTWQVVMDGWTDELGRESNIAEDIVICGGEQGAAGGDGREVEV